MSHSIQTTLTNTIKFGIVAIVLTVSLKSILVQAQSPVTTFDYPLGDDIYDYGPILWHYGDPPMIVEDTRYGIKNPDLGSIVKCFGEPWHNLYHAGEDWYRFDKNTGEMLETAGVDVKAVGDGIIKYISPDEVFYPGYAVIIEHPLSPPRDGYDKIYSVYMHLDDTYVISGATVSKGTPLGTVLTQTWTGTNPDPNRPAYDSHLHWEMRYLPDASNIYTNYPACNKGDMPGRGYTYPEHPDDFPTNTPYLNPSNFVAGYTMYLPLFLKQWPPIPNPPTVHFKF